MTIHLEKEERQFFEHLIELHRDDAEHLADYGILEDDLRVVKMRVESREQNIDVNSVVDSLVKKNVLEKKNMKKEASGIRRDDESDTLHSTGTKEVEKYVIVNAHILEEIRDRIE